MNLHGIVVNAIAQVNPLLPVSVQISTGSALNADYSETPGYAPPIAMQAQMQALQYKDLMQTDALNIAGVRQALYLYGDEESLVRMSNKGGDLITFPDGSVWLTALVLERWSTTANWCKIAITMQNGS